MQNSLSLAGHGEASVPSGIKAMEALLYRFAGNSGEAVAGNGHRGQTSDQQGAVRSEAPAGPSSGGKPDLSDVSGTAARFLGTPYRFGGEGPTGIDCSSFVQQVFREHEIELPRTAREQILVGVRTLQSPLATAGIVRPPAVGSREAIQSPKASLSKTSTDSAEVLITVPLYRIYCLWHEHE